MRGQFRPAVDPTHVRRVWLTALTGVVLLFLGTMLDHPVAMVAAYLLGFLVLVVMAASVFRLVALPQTFELDARRLGIGEDDYPLASIERVEATDGPPKLVVILRDGRRRVVVVSAEHHNVDDLGWLAWEVNRRLPGAP